MQEQILQALRRQDADQAVQLATRWIADEPQLPQAHRWHALALQQQGQLPAAVESLQRALALAPDDADLHLQHAGLLLALHQFEAAEAALGRTTGFNPNELSAYLMQAHLALARNDVDEAEKQLKLAARVDAENPEVVALSGMVALRRGALDEALAQLSSAVRALPDDPRIVYALGTAYLGKDMLAFAEQAFRRVLVLNPKMTALHGLLVQLALRQDNPAAAAELIEQALQQPGQDSVAMRRFAAQLALQSGQPLQARDHLRPLLAANAGDPQLLQLLLMAWQRLGRDDEARSELDAVLADHDQLHNLWLARLSVEGVGSEGAVAVGERWLAAMPAHLPALETRMRLHDMTGEHDAAEAMAERILALEPGRVSGATRLVDGLVQRDPAAAAARVQQMVDGAEGRAREDLRTWLGEVHDRGGQPREALRTWLELHADNVANRLPLPPQAKAPASWPALGEVDPELASRPMFLWGAPGSNVEKVMSALSAASPLVRVDRFSATPPDDAFQNYNTLQDLASGKLSPQGLVDGWRARLPSRGLSNDTVIDWLLFWDNALLWALRPALPQGRLLVVLRDPRDMLLDWIAYGSGAQLAITSLQEAAEWLARALTQVAVLNEQDLYPNVLVRVDAAGNDPQAMALLLSEVMGVQLPVAPNIGPPRLPSGHWRNYREVMGAAIDLLTPVAVRLGYPEE
ncbi:tetratricopeptide repeat protein [Stenotrophomonas sp. SORGH_AS_0321]|uniref:tetratricopeptide repeat protein n=1 Tax=Stenotrophomonas sp. SORGH_AS_0321 TaxID=3041787 RepID=UPI00286402B8|nr:tetratricopeptide repeat protein [Stenotrophomonas sp. SORGH_AS_0321]MDR6096241.1 tetratricopeptide (TPR) repeat protein [Stenotrophomonas sp. SORGH_AS_0321]